MLPLAWCCSVARADTSALVKQEGSRASSKEVITEATSAAPCLLVCPSAGIDEKSEQTGLTARNRTVSKSRDASLFASLRQPLYQGRVLRPDHPVTQGNFASPAETAVILDWDDTLFPTSFLQDKLGLNMCRKLADQKGSLPWAQRAAISSEIAACEKSAIELLRAADTRGHVFIVTLARPGWVNLLCNNFFPKFGAEMRNLHIRVIYAKENAENSEIAEQERENQPDQTGGSNHKEQVRRHLSLVKARVMYDELRRFYSQYEGQTWKNVIAIGDSCFEMYGLLIAASSYLQGQQVSDSVTHVYDTLQQDLWERSENGRLLKVRVKCCWLVDSPDMAEVCLQLRRLSKWLGRIVEVDASLTLEFPYCVDESNVQLVEAVLEGRRPVSELASLHEQHQN